MLVGEHRLMLSAQGVVQKPMVHTRAPFTCTHRLAWYLFHTAHVCHSVQSGGKVTL